MPIYEYLCDNCGHELESLQKIVEQPLVYCPECGDAALKRKVSAAAFRLKGTGWYETDFKDKSKGKEKEKDKDKPKAKSTEEPKDSAETKSDSADSGKSAKSGTGKSSGGDGSTKSAAGTP